MNNYVRLAYYPLTCRTKVERLINYQVLNFRLVNGLPDDLTLIACISNNFYNVLSHNRSLKLPTRIPSSATRGVFRKKILARTRRRFVSVALIRNQRPSGTPRTRVSQLTVTTLPRHVSRRGWRARNKERESANLARVARTRSGGF